MSKFDIHPVLIDVGASGEQPKIWDVIAPYSIYIGFDPDQREIYEESFSHFYKKWIMNEAVTSDQNSELISFYLTKSPYCSSTLRPDLESLSDYLLSELFVVEKETQARAISLNSVLERFSLPGVDWLKVDSQGTDLRIFNSLRDDTRSRVLALDIEPGLISAYKREDLFVEAHSALIQNGFWLSNLVVGGSVRLRRSTLEKISAFNKNISYSLIEGAIKRSPIYCEARYMRTLSWLTQKGFAQRDYILLWVFALLDGQVGFALDLASEYEKVFGKDDVLRVLYNEPFLRLRQARARISVRMVLKFLVPTRLRRWLKSIFMG
jgi:FkbM family methyltransferase